MLNLNENRNVNKTSVHSTIIPKTPCLITDRREKTVCEGSFVEVLKAHVILKMYIPT